MRSWCLLCDCGKTSAWRVADASGTPFVRSRESLRPQGFLRACGGGLLCESGANPRPRPRSLALRLSALRSRSRSLWLTSPRPRPPASAPRPGQPRRPISPTNPAQPAKGRLVAGFDGKPPSLGAHEGKPAKGEWVDQGILLIGAAGSSKEAESLSVKGSFPSKPARNSDCLCQARIDRGRVGPPRAERPGASEAPDPSGGALRGARPEGSGSELEEHGFVSTLV